MPKDDYAYLVFRILTYLYGCFKRKAVFEEAVFLKKIATKSVCEEYLLDTLRLMQQDGLIEGLAFVKAWGGEYILANEYAGMRITPEGIRFLSENSRMQKIKEKILSGAPGAILELVRLVFL